MKKKPAARSGFFYPRILIGFVLCFLGLVLAVFALAPSPNEPVAGQGTGGTPREGSLIRAAHSFDGDLRVLPHVPPIKKERPELEQPQPNPRLYQPSGGTKAPNVPLAPVVPSPSAAAPGPSITFDGLDFANWGAGHPPDENGDVGPAYYIQVVNTSIGIYDKTNGTRVAAFTFDTFMSQGQFGNLCDTDNFGDPVVLYDSFEDRWIITDFAFQLDGSGNAVAPAYQCFAASKTGDPVAGGWNFFSVQISDALGDYPKFGIWPDGLYMSANMFGFGVGGTFKGPRVWAINKAQMYAGAPTIQVVSFDAPSADFTLLPSNARLQTGTPPTGAPNYFISTWEYLNALTVYKFHVDWSSISLSTFTGPDIPLTGSSWPNAAPANAATPGNSLDVLPIRAMQRNQYTNTGGAESLWTIHTVERATSGFATPRWYQVNVTGGTVAANTVQTATWDPDGANVTYRYVPSLAVDRMGDVAIGYSTSNSTTNPGIKYAGRLATDSLNTFSQTEQLLWQGTGTQSGNCGGTCTRWGDYTAMMLDPDGCTFWYTNEYYTASGLNDLTRIGAFAYPQCTPVGNGGTVSGTVTRASDNSAISAATVALGSRITTTDGNGHYSFNVPAGTYPTITASDTGYDSVSVNSVVVADNGTTTQNFSLTAAPTSGCLTDTTPADFQAGTPTNVDLTTSPGDVKLLASSVLDQSNESLSNTGSALSATTWWGQTFTEGITGTLQKADISLFCANCTGAAPNLTLSLRATTANLPTGADLATATLSGSSSGAASYFSGIFTTNPTLNAGTVYALIVRPVSNPSAGTYAATFSSSNVYAGGQRVTSADGNGQVWGTPTGSSRDLGFHVYVNAGFASSGNFVSSVKDANPGAGANPTWGSISWNASVPANTTLKFQVAASNNVNGPFNFVGPDGTANTFFNSGNPLSQFNGLRYLRYKAFFTGTSSASPILNDVTICFNDVAPPILAFNSAVSRQIHGSTAFDINLPLSGAPGIECRSGGGNYTVIFTFSNTISAIQGAVSDCGSVSSASVDGTDAHNVVVQLNGGVCNQQYVTITLSGVNDTFNQTLNSAAVRLGLLPGDTTGDGSVNSADISQTKSRSGSAVDGANFRSDVTVDGNLNSADISLVKSKSGTALPPP